jgi:L-fucose mutarotase
MLKGIHPLLTPELLKVLREMGHGDEIVLADANFTAESLSHQRPVIRLAGAGMAQACQAVLSLLPLDEFVPRPIAFMKVGDTPAGYLSELQRQVIEQFGADGVARAEQCEPVERFAFYERTGRAYAIVQTGELQPWANFIFKKGVIAEPLRR